MEWNQMQTNTHPSMQPTEHINTNEFNSHRKTNGKKFGGIGFQDDTQSTTTTTTKIFNKKKTIRNICQIIAFFLSIFFAKVLHVIRLKNREKYKKKKKEKCVDKSQKSATLYTRCHKTQR